MYSQIDKFLYNQQTLSKSSYFSPQTFLSFGSNTFSTFATEHIAHEL